jgi:hypothetical protein
MLTGTAARTKNAMHIISRLSSLVLTWWILLGTAAWFALGSLGTSYAPFEEGLSGLTALLVRQWLTSHGPAHPWTLSWLAVLLLLVVILGTNLIACLWKRVQKSSRNKGPRFWIFMAVHILFGLVMLLHGLETVLGEKYPQQSVQAGDVIPLAAGWGVQIKDITYVNDLRLLHLERHAARRAMTSDSFDLQANRVRLSLVHKGKTVHAGTIRMLHPLEHAGWHLILRGFTSNGQKIGAKIKVVKSPVHKPFFIAYALLIVSLIASFLLSLVQKRTGNSLDDA